MESELIGVALRYYEFPGSGDPRSARSNFERQLAVALRTLQSQGYQLRFLCQSPDGPRSDAVYAREFLQRFQLDAEVVDEVGSHAALMSEYASLRILIGVRLHGCISALTQGVPVVAIGYEPKTWGAMCDVGLSDYWTSITDVDSDRLLDAAQRAMVLTDQDIQEISARVRSCAERASDFLRHAPARRC